MVLKRLKSSKGQAVLAEYVMVFFLVVAAISTMTVYIRRSLQAKMRDARNTMINKVADDADVLVQYEYEPYYTQSQSGITRNEKSVKTLNNGTFIKAVDNTINVISATTVLDPSAAD